ncbi:MAG: Xaa-Pro peptidase family protein [Candidatus Nezhaarchaeales archaeon]
MEGKVPKKVIKSRVKKLKELMLELDANGLLLTQPENVQYVTGFNVVGNPPKSSWALILEEHEEAYLLVPALEYYEALDEVESAEVVLLNKDKRVMEAITDFLVEKRMFGPICLDDLHNQELMNFIRRKLGIEDLRSIHPYIEGLRAKKDDYEVSCIKEAVEKAKKGLERGLEVLREGIKEVSLAAEIEKVLREEGVENMAFDIVIASGYRSSYPHAKPTTKRIERGESVVIDLGVRVQGYCSDLTRTFIVGSNREIEDLLTCVVDVQRECALEIRSGTKASLIDAKARCLLKERGLHEQFLHGLGHGIGLSVHEKPTMSSLSEDILERGNVITVEPGVYFRGKFGVRHEDVFLVDNHGCIKLS